MTAKKGVIILGLILLIIFLSISTRVNITSLVVHVFDSFATSDVLQVSIAVRRDFTPPSMIVDSPANTFYSTGVIGLNWTASDSESGVDTVWYNLNRGENTTLENNITLTLPNGDYTIYIFANDSVGNENGTESVSFSVNVPKTINVIYTRYDYTTTNFSAMNDEELVNIPNLTLEIQNYGKIVYNETINISQDTDLDTYADISYNNVFLDSDTLPYFNKPATLYIYGLTFTNPRILKDGSVCPESACTKVSYSGGTLEFTVTGFTVYSAEETPTTAVSPLKAETGRGSYAGAPPGPTEFSSVTSVDISKGSFVGLTTTQSASFTSKGVNYIADVKQIGEDFVKIWVYYRPESTIQIEPVEAVISVGKRANIDLDGDSWADVSVELKGLKDGNAFLYFKELKSQGPSKISIPTGEQVFVEEVGEEDFELPKITLSPKGLISKKGFMGLLKNFESFVRSKVGQFELPKIMLRAKALITGKFWSKQLQTFENLVRNNVDCWVSNVKTKKSWLLPSAAFIGLLLLFFARSLTFYLEKKRLKGKLEGLS